MPTSWPKDDATLSSYCLLCFTTLPSLQSHIRTDSSTRSTNPLPQKRFLFSAFLHGEVFPALPTTPFSSIASCLGAFLWAGFSRKELFSSFHLSCLPCSLTLPITNTRTQCSFDQAHLSRLSMTARSRPFHQTKD